MWELSSIVSTNTGALLIAFAVDLLVGDPVSRLHPARITGLVIGWLDRTFHRDSVMRGAAVSIVVICGAVGVTVFVLVAAYRLHPVAYVGVSGFIMYLSLSVKSLAVHARKVANPLSLGDVDGARHQLSMIVSRDTDGMDEPGIARGAIESVGENFIDGVVSPVLFAIVFGAPGMVLFKAASTLDSMIGYHTERYERFGRFAARLDDALGFIPARASILFIATAALVTGMDWRGAWRVFSAERLLHKSPNAGHGIAAFAGALGVKLGGAAMYHGAVIMKPVINDDGKDPGADDIIRGVRLMEASAIVLVLVMVLSVRAWFGGGA